MYIRVILNYERAGDDSYDHLVWWYRLAHEGAWNIWAEGLRELKNQLLLKVDRFYPFNARGVDRVVWHFTESIVSYRLFLITLSCATGIAFGTLLWRLTNKKWLGMAFFALMPLMFCLPGGIMTSYDGIVTNTLLRALLSAHCMVSWAHTRHWRWAGLSAFFMFMSCGTYELGYILIIALGFFALMLHDRFRDSVCTGLPAAVGELIAMGFRVASGRGKAANASVDFNFDIPKIVETTLKQMWGGVPNGLAIASKRPWPETWTYGDLFWSFCLAFVCVAALYLITVPLSRKQWVCLSFAGLCILAGPALMIGLSSKYQTVGWISWRTTYIPAEMVSYGVGCTAMLLMLGALQLVRGARHRKILRLGFAGAMVVLLTASGIYTRSITRVVYPPESRYNYELHAASITDGIADNVRAEDILFLNFSPYGGNERAAQSFFRRYGERELQVYPSRYWTQNNPAEEIAEDTTLYLMGISDHVNARSASDYSIVWLGYAQDKEATLMRDVRIYIDGAKIPENAVLQYSVKMPDGNAEQRMVALNTLPRTEINEKGRYFVILNDQNIDTATFLCEAAPA